MASSVVLATDHAAPPLPSRPPRQRFERLVMSLDSCPEPSTPAFRAAVLLACAREVGQNVDKLARSTGYPREFVARCARRLYDNGVWRDGQTVALWTDPRQNELAFWTDVAVAEGKLCRRMDDDGQLHWAPPGFWQKRFDYREATPADPWTDYLLPAVPGDLFVGRPVAQENGPARRERAELGDSPSPPVQKVLPPARDAERYAAGAQGRSGAPALSSSAELFPEAVWLK